MQLARRLDAAPTNSMLKTSKRHDRIIHSDLDLNAFLCLVQMYKWMLNDA